MIRSAWIRLWLTMVLSTLLTGCFVTKVVTVPLRAGGAVISVVPIVGDPIDKGVGAVAGAIDAIPL